MDEEEAIIKKLEKDIKGQMTSRRFTHTMGVVETAKDLAAIYQVDPCKATMAALLHDIAKEMTSARQRELCKEYKIDLDNFSDKNIHLVHGQIGACIAKENYNINDRDILNAVTNHTLGARNMSDLEKIIYIADIIEPGRKSYDGLQSLREMAYRDLNTAMLWVLKYNVDYLTRSNRQVHPIIYRLIEEYEK